MICPNCGSNIPEGLHKCPACHAELDRPYALPDERGRWCVSCGAAIPEGSDVCPSCGMPVEPEDTVMRLWRRQGAKSPDDTVGDLPSDRDRTNVMPRIESAIPDGDDPTSPVAEHDRMPRTKTLVITIAAAVAVICGAVLVITHPWDPNAFDTSATEEADTSMAGFPGKVDSLQGQDKSGSSSTDVVSGDEATFEKLQSYYEQLGELEQKIDDNEDTFDQIAFSGSKSEREKARDEAETISYEVSNLISDIESVDVTSGTYAEDEENLATLGNYLRNRIDVLYEAWERDCLYDDPSSGRSLIMAPLLNDNGDSITDSYKKLFDDNYESWEPTEKSGEDSSAS